MLNTMLPNYVIVVFSWKFELCLSPNYVAILFLRVLATGSGGKTQTQRVWVW
jgi:hypothetical protein